MLMIHKPKCEKYDLTTIRTSSESHLHWKDHFHEKPLYFRIYPDVEAANETDISRMVNRTTNIYKQNPVPNGYHIIFELEDVLESGYYKSPLAYDNVDWFINEVIKLENKMAFYFRNTKKDIIMTEDDEEYFKNNNFCRLRENKVSIDKVKDHCHLTGNNKGPAKYTCDKKVNQQQGKAIPFISRNFSNYDCHMFFKRSVDLKNDRVKFKIFPKTDEEYISVRCGCIVLYCISYRFL